MLGIIRPRRRCPTHLAISRWAKDLVDVVARLYNARRPFANPRVDERSFHLTGRTRSATTNTMGDALTALSFMSEDGWPYPDDDDVAEQPEPIDLRSETDDDLVALHALPRRALADLTSTERLVITRRFGFDGQPPCSLSQLHRQLGMSRREIRLTLLDALTKLRSELSAP